MADRYEKFIEDTFRLRENEGRDKVISLREAVARYVKPGSKIHVAATHCCSNAAILEIARQFRAKKPRFTLIMRGIRDTGVILLHMGLVKKVITTFSGNVYPYYGPNPVAQEAYSSRKVELEDWSILTFPLMLMAGAFGTGVVATNSLVGSDLAKLNKDSFRVIDDPFGSGKKIGLIKALNPDLSIVHGLAADREGNVLLAPPYSESTWGAKASKGGVLATVEQLVSTDFVRKHSHMVKIPAYMVNSVSVVPMGAHPGGVWDQGVEKLAAYAEDYEFMTGFNSICRDGHAMDEWIKEWVVGCPSFDEYREKLGKTRIKSLKKGADREAWLDQVETAKKTVSGSRKYSVTEMMVIAAAREIESSILSNGHETVLAGAGTANLAAWVAKYNLAKKGKLVELMVELGYYGNSPRPGEPFLLNFGNFPTCKMLTETLDTLGVFTCGATNKCIGVLGGGQVDKFGNINSSWLSPELYLTGSGGANDVATGASEVMVVMNQSPKRFLDKVSFVTAPGHKVRKLVSSLGVFEKLGNDREFTLTKYFADKRFSSKGEIVGNIKKNCGWELKVANNPQPVAAPSSKELVLLRTFDPKKYYIG